MNSVIYKVVPVIKFEMLFGYRIVKIENNIYFSTGYEYGEDEKHIAEAKCELKNLLNN